MPLCACTSKTRNPCDLICLSDSPADLIALAEYFAIALLDCICNAEVVEQPLVRVSPIRMILEAAPFLLLPLAPCAPGTLIGGSSAPLGDARHAELAGADLDVFAVDGGAGAAVKAGELS
jgi:hypothetical protein